MHGQSIICMSKDRREAVTSNHHVMRELARDNLVIWLDSVGTRAPNLGSARDLRKMFTKVGEFLRGPRRDTDGVWVFTPLVLPLPHVRAAVALNRQLLRLTVWWLKKRFGIGEFQLWTFLPTAADYVGALGESLVVYYCVDEYALFHYVDGPSVAAADLRLTRHADVVFCATSELAQAKRALNPRTFVAPHGVAYDRFRTALDDGPVPEDVAHLPRPILGFYGTVESWVDLPLVAHLARRHPEWTVVLIGPVHTDTTALGSLRNVHVLGPRPYEQLPAYCRAFSVGLIPYVLDERMRYVNPIKLREYLSAGLPVVSSAVPEAMRYRPLCRVADGPDAFVAAVEDALSTDTPYAREQRSHAMAGETWQRRVAEVSARVMAIVDAKRRQAKASGPEGRDLREGILR